MAASERAAHDVQALLFDVIDRALYPGHPNEVPVGLGSVLAARNRTLLTRGRLGLGSGCDAVLARDIARPRFALGWCQLLQVAAIAWAALMMTSELPFWPISPALVTSHSIKFQVDLVRCACAILPAAFLWGASFPLALAAAANPGQDSAHIVSRVYAANTVGAILGAVVTSLVLFPALGTQHTEQLLIVLSVAGAFAVLWTPTTSCRSARPEVELRPARSHEWRRIGARKRRYSLPGIELERSI